MIELVAGVVVGFVLYQLGSWVERKKQENRKLEALAEYELFKLEGDGR